MFGAEISNSHCKGGWVMTYDADAPTVVLQFEHLRSQQRRRHEPSEIPAISKCPAIKMLIGDWYVDEFGVLMREITARD